MSILKQNGFTKKSHEVLDQNNSSNEIGINFTYDDLVKQNNKTLYEMFLNFLEEKDLIHFSPDKNKVN